MRGIKVGDTVEFLEDYNHHFHKGDKSKITWFSDKYYYAIDRNGNSVGFLPWRVKKVEPEMKFGPWKKYNGGGITPVNPSTIIKVKQFILHDGNTYDSVGPAYSFFWGYSGDVILVAYQEQIKEPIVKTTTLYGKKSVYTVSRTINDTHKITFNTIDGEPDTTSIKMEKL